MVEAITVVCDGAANIDEACEYLDSMEIDYRPVPELNEAVEAFVDDTQRELIVRELKRRHYGIVEGE